MSAELVRGQNHPLPGSRLEIRVSAGTPVVVAVTLGDEEGRVIRDAPPAPPAPSPGGATEPAVGVPPAERGWLAHPGSPQLPGVEVPRQAAAEHRLAVDLGAMPAQVHRVNVLLALPAGRPGSPRDFGGAPAPYLAVSAGTAVDGTPAATFTITGLGSETALLAVELYRRLGSWKVRAVGQGYAGGLHALLLDQGVAEAAAIASAVQAAAAREQSRSVALPAHGPAPGAAGRAPAGATTSGTAAAAQAAPPGPVGAAAGSAGGAGIDYRHPRRRSDPQPVLPLPSAGGAPSQGPPAGDFPAQVPPVPGYDPATPGARHGASQPPQVAPAGNPGAGAPAAGAPRVPVAGDASGWTMEERLHNQIWGMFEDLARSVAAYRSAADFAQSRYGQELDRLLADPRTRGGPAADAARDEAQLKQAALVDQARAALDRDLAQLSAEADVVEPALPPAFAGWESPVWHGYRVPSETPMAVRLGSLSLPEAPELRIPLLARLPLDRGVWLDAAEDRRAALEAAVAIAARLLASHPAGAFAVDILDPAGSGAAALAPLYAAGAVVRPASALGVSGVATVLGRLTERVDLLHMAMRGGVPDALPRGFDTGEQLLVVNDFPYGFDDRAITQLRYLVDEGPAAGVHLLLVAAREDAEQYGPVLDPLWRTLLRLTPLPSDHLADPWVGHAWTFEPALVPPGSQVLAQVLRQLGAARPAFG